MIREYLSMMWLMNPFVLDPCPEEIAKYCHLIETPNWHVEGFWTLVASVGMWTFLHFWAKEAEAMAWETHELEKEGKRAGINSGNYLLVYAASRAGQLLSIGGGLVGLSRWITGR
jgi:hypothetical protein